MPSPEPVELPCEIHFRFRKAPKGAFRVECVEIVDDGATRRPEPLDADPAELGFEVEPDWIETQREARVAPWRIGDDAAFTERWDTLREALFAALPAPIQERLRALLATGRFLRLVIAAEPEVALLPWEAICDHGFDQPVSTGRWELVRRPIEDEAAAAAGPEAAIAAAAREPVERRALVLVGSLRQAPWTLDAEHEVAAIVEALFAADFEVTVASALVARDGQDLATAHGPLRIDRALDRPERALAIIRELRPALVHYVGHSWRPQTVGGRDTDAAVLFGATGLKLEAAGTESELRFDALATALRDAGVRMLVLHACDVREHAATELLRASGVERVISAGAILVPAHAAAFARGFYGSFAAPRPASIAAAFRNGLTSLAHLAPSLTWIPQHWAAPDAGLGFAAADEQAVADYCRSLAASIDRFEGRFYGCLNGEGPSAVYVQLQVGGKDDSREELTFAALMARGLPRILLRGAPGAGKSTTLRMYARALAVEPLRGRVPVFVRLTAWLPHVDPKAPVGVIDHIVRQDAANEGEAGQRLLANRLRALGREGRLVFLLDGRDELDGSVRIQLDAELTRLGAAFPRCPVVVSSRDFQTSGWLKGFELADIQPLTPERARELLERFLSARGYAGDIAADGAAWERRFRNGPRVWIELGQVPLFVALIADLLQKGHAIQVGSRAEFFDLVFWHLCLDQHRGEDHVDPDRADPGSKPLITPHGDTESAREEDARARVAIVLDVLGQLALRMTTACRVQATRADLEKWLQADGGKLLAPLRAAGLEYKAGPFLESVAERTRILAPERAPEEDEGRDTRTTWRFWHRSFQEALTAWVLERDLLPREGVAGLVARVRLEPNDDEIRAARQSLERACRADRGGNKDLDVLRRANALSTAQEYREWTKGNFSAGSWQDHDKRIIGQAAIVAAHDARNALQDFWAQPIALLAGRLEDRCDARWRTSDAASTSIDVVAVLVDFVAAKRDSEPTTRAAAELGRRSVMLLDACPVEFVGLALDNSTRTDADVRSAGSANELYEGLTLRLTDRAHVYSRLAKTCADHAGLATALAERVPGVDDPGELFLIDELLAMLSLSAAVTAAQRAVRARLGTPDVARWLEHFERLDGGEFEMGSEDGTLPLSLPRRTIKLGPFGLGRTPVTVDLYADFWPDHRMEVDGALGRVGDPAWRDRRLEDGRVGDCPASYVSWFAARMCVRWLGWHWSAFVAADPSLADLVPALPTEPQLEYAIRGGSAKRYWFGDDEARLNDHAWFADNSGDRSHPVGSRPSNRFGLLGVIGSVWQWCEDAYAAYPSAEGVIVDPEAVRGDSAALRVARGGSFVSTAQNCRSANRDRDRPADAGGLQGFRVALVSSAAAPQPGSVLR